MKDVDMKNAGNETKGVNIIGSKGFQERGVKKPVKFLSATQNNQRINKPEIKGR